MLITIEDNDQTRGRLKVGTLQFYNFAVRADDPAFELRVPPDFTAAYLQALGQEGITINGQTILINYSAEFRQAEELRKAGLSEYTVDTGADSIANFVVELLWKTATGLKKGVFDGREQGSIELFCILYPPEAGTGRGYLEILVLPSGSINGLQNRVGNLKSAVNGDMAVYETGPDRKSVV